VQNSVGIDNELMQSFNTPNHASLLQTKCYSVSDIRRHQTPSLSLLLRTDTQSRSVPSSSAAAAFFSSVRTRQQYYMHLSAVCLNVQRWLPISPPGGIAIRRVCWLVCLFVESLWWVCVFVNVFVNKCWGRITKTVGDTGSIAMDHQQEMAYGESNGHVTDDAT